MKLEYKDIVNKHENIPAVVALHGPSLDDHKEKIQELQRDKKIIRLSVNNWYDYFSVDPDYWVVSNGEYTVKASMTNDSLWVARQFPHDIFNKYKIPLLYNSSIDLTEKQFLDKLQCDYFQYDIRHFKGHSCKEILLNFKEHYNKNKNLDFLYYGNNKEMWQKPDVSEFPEWIKRIHGRVAGAWSVRNKCCDQRKDITLQEKLQQISSHDKHAGPLSSVGFCALTLAVLMGCNPIYVSGLDLDYTLGYAKSPVDVNAGINVGNIGHWKKIFRNSILNDMAIIDQSSALLGKKIINLNKNSWYNVLTKGDIEI
jgi:hypothetical protein